MSHVIPLLLLWVFGLFFFVFVFLLKHTQSSLTFDHNLCRFGLLVFFFFFWSFSVNNNERGTTNKLFSCKMLVLTKKKTDIFGH